MKQQTKAQRIIIITAFAALFAAWAFLAKTGRLAGFDGAVQNFFFSLRCPVLNAIGVSLEYVGHWPLPAVVGVIMLAMKKTRFSYGIPMAACVVTSVGMYELLKHLIKRPRPSSLLWLCQEHGFSFPSGHTLNNTVFWVVFASLLGYYFLTGGKSLPLYKKDRSTVVYPKKKGVAILLRILIIAWPLIIGMSRILVGVHWPSDVIGSLLLSVVLIETGYSILFPLKNNNA